MSYKLKDFPTYEQIKGMIERVQGLQHRALFCIMYGTGCRVGELVKIRAQDCTLEEINGQTVFLVKIFTEKNPRQKTRICPINCVKEYWIVKPIADYVGGMEKGLLFDYSTRWVNMLSHKLFAFNPHNFRHFRFTHFGTKIPKPIAKQFFGWATDQPMQIYDHLGWRDTIPYILGFENR